jgi:hypothetical protein
MRPAPVAHVSLVIGGHGRLLISSTKRCHPEIGATGCLVRKPDQRPMPVAQVVEHALGWSVLPPPRLNSKIGTPPDGTTTSFVAVEGSGYPPAHSMPCTKRPRVERAPRALRISSRGRTASRDALALDLVRIRIPILVPTFVVRKPTCSTSVLLTCTPFPPQIRRVGCRVPPSS